LEPILHIDNLTKRFGRITAVNQLSLTVNPGEVFGLLGPNGSGKTTTLGIILGVITPTSGTYSWFGREARANQRKQVGAILENPIFYPYMSGKQNLEIVATIKEVNLNRIPEVLNQVGLAERAKDKFKTYSLGMKQRLAIASALIANPQVLIFDEPTNGLDPQGIAEIRNLITTIAAQGKTIILASHLLDEVQKVCSHFAVMQQGKMLHSGSVNASLGGVTTVEVAASDMQGLQKQIEGFGRTRQVNKENGMLEVQLEEGVSSYDLNQHLVKEGVVVSHLVTRTKSLEKQFLEILSEQNG
jgi:ABC-type multidrug transport system ATPase subunit